MLRYFTVAGQTIMVSHSSKDKYHTERAMCAHLDVDGKKYFLFMKKWIGGQFEFSAHLCGNDGITEHNVQRYYVDGRRLSWKKFVALAQQFYDEFHRDAEKVAA